MGQTKKISHRRRMVGGVLEMQNKNEYGACVRHGWVKKDTKKSTNESMMELIVTNSLLSSCWKKILASLFTPSLTNSSIQRFKIMSAHATFHPIYSPLLYFFLVIAMWTYHNTIRQANANSSPSHGQDTCCLSNNICIKD